MDLRDRIAAVLDGHPIGIATSVATGEAQDMADAIIDGLGLWIEFGDGREDRYRRIVGPWEVDR